MKPYTYFIKSKITGEFYYGVKYSKDANPEMFWKNYFTSSNTVKNLVERDGKDSFEFQIRKIFETREQALNWEQNVIRKIRNWNGCLNISLGGDAIKSHKNRSIIGEDGLTSYQRAGKKLSQNLKNNPEMVSNRIKKAQETLSIIGEDGLSGHQRRGLKISGENNPSKKPENKKKISDGNKKWRDENPILVKENQEKSNIAMLEIGEDGLNCRQRHSEFMKENNPASDTIWVNNGEKNLRVKSSEIPVGYNIGRKSFKHKTKMELVVCPHCNKEGRGGNMKRYHFNNCKLS